jgi:ribonuclease HI
MVLPMETLPEVRLYTDGGCRPNPGPGGWGVVVVEDDRAVNELAGGEPGTTNNRMELRAAVEGLRSLDEPHRVSLYTDSKYLRDGVTRWMPKWVSNGWKTSGRSEVKNQDLWRSLDAELGRHRVTWHWVKGHAGDRWNERADELASSAIPRPELPVDDAGAVHLFMAAAYAGKRKLGSWAAVLRFADNERVLRGSESKTSANRMHLAGAVAGLAALKRPVRVHLYTASDYLKDGATAWIGGWKSRGWRTREGRPVRHRDLWQRLERLLSRHRVSWHVVERESMPEEMKHAKTVAREELDGPQPEPGDR